MAWVFQASSTDGFTATGTVSYSLPISMSCWVRPFETTTNKTVFSMCGSTATNNNFRFDLSSTGGSFIRSQTATNTRSANGGSYASHTWIHFGAMWVNASTRIITVNGKWVSGGTSCPSVAPTRFAIGCMADSSKGTPMIGEIGEVYVWNDYVKIQEMQWLSKGNDPELLRSKRHQIIFKNRLDDAARFEGKATRQATFVEQGDPRPGETGPWIKKFQTAERVVDAAMAVLLAGAGAVMNNVTLAATAVGVTSLVRQVGKITTATGSGVTAFVRQVADNLNATGVGITGSVFSASKTLAVTATGVAALTATKVIQVVLAAIALGVTTLVKQAQLITAATATGVTAFVRGVATSLSATAVGITGNVFSAAKTLSATAVGVATLTATKVFQVVLAAIALGVTTLVKQAQLVSATTATGVTAFVRGVATNLNATAVGITGSVFSAAKTLGVTAVGVASITISFVVSQALAVVAIGVTAITMQVSKILAAVGVGTAGMSQSAATAATATSTEQPGPYLGGGGIGLYGRYGAARRFAKRRRK